MSLRLALLPHLLPQRAKLRLLDELAYVTAEGFDVPPPVWDSPSFDARLTQYARFTAREAEGLLALTGGDAGDDGAVAAARMRLHDGARRLGRSLRRTLFVRRPGDALQAFLLLYHEIGIDISTAPRGEITVERCFFAGHYTEPVCAVVMALDQGVAEGLFDGASLEFRERLTGGRSCCRAFLSPSRPSS